MVRVPKRFSLRVLLLSVTILLVGVGFLSNMVRGYLVERDMLRMLVVTDKFDPVYQNGSLVPGFVNSVG